MVCPGGEGGTAFQERRQNGGTQAVEVCVSPGVSRRKLQPQQAWPPGHCVLSALTPAGSVRRAQKLRRVKTKEGAEGPLLPGPHHNGQRERREETGLVTPLGTESGSERERQAGLRLAVRRQGATWAWICPLEGAPWH